LIPATLPTFDLTYYPMVRGPYNYNTDDLTSEGLLTDPETRWAGIMRGITVNDFEAANIEYMEFWVMDPFIEDPGAKGGEVYINLGSVSEDILKDGRKQFENGLPVGDEDGSDSTRWGQVPSGFQVTTNFTNKEEDRPFQDVGLDGLGDEQEQNFFSDYIQKVQGIVTDPTAFINDPSGDNFSCFLDEAYSTRQADILERYSDINNTQGNTPVQRTLTNCIGTQLPDDEDANRDFNLDQIEEYYEYKLKLDPAAMTVGQNYITNIQESPVRLANGRTEQVKWYQFKVPIRSYERKIGDIPDFKSIRFMRIYMTGFEDTTTLRFAQLQLVRADWRKYNYSLRNPGEYIPGPGEKEATFNVSTVNLEENGRRKPLPYVLPPGIKRELDPSTPSLVQINEQSLSLQVCNLEDGDAQAVFRTLSYDIRQYKRLKMFVHAETSEPNAIENGELKLFIRLGTDFNSNYYEYEIPLQFSAHNSNSQEEIWPAANYVDLALEAFYTAKQEREARGVSQGVVYTTTVDGQTISLLGNPDLGNVRTILIGIRNPKGGALKTPCAEIWVNELRVTDFNEYGGWAANARVTTKLADFGRAAFTFNKRSIGFGGLEQSLMERNQVDMTFYEVFTAFELGKFFPAKANVRIPLYYSHSELINKPLYDPLFPDLTWESRLKLYQSEHPDKIDSIRRAGEDYTSRTSLNFTNVQKLRSLDAPKDRKAKLYDIENFSLTYIYSQVYRRNIERVYDIERTHSGQLGYNYTFNTKNIMPFKSIKNKHLKLISEFNFNTLPQSFSFRAVANRRYGEKLYRNTDNIKTVNVPFYDKRFTWGRFYDLNWAFTRALRFTFHAEGESFFDEPLGKIDTDEKKSAFWDSIKTGGKLNTYSHNVRLNYALPISKLPFMDWVTTSEVGYTGGFDWRRSPPAADSLGHAVSNSQAITFTGQLNFTSFYNKFAFLRNINSGKGNADAMRKKRQEDLDDARNASGDTAREEATVNEGSLKTAERFLGLLMTLRNVNFNYTLTNGMFLPGFNRTPQLLGQDFNSGAPGWPFALGFQEDIRQQAADENWLVTNQHVSNNFLKTGSETFNMQATLEPIKNFRVTLDFNKRTTTRFQELWKYDPFTGRFEHMTPVEGGSYSISFIALRSSFKKDDTATNESPIFTQFENNRFAVASRIANQDPRVLGQRDPVTGYPVGYSSKQQDVLIPAFVAAYEGKNNATIPLTAFPRMPAPNWKVAYSGLSNNKKVQEYAKSVSIEHGYRATYSINSYISSLSYAGQVPELGEDLKAERQIESINLQESFSPLLGINVNWVNNLTTHLEYSKSRNLNFNFSNYQLTEVKNDEFVIGMGFRKSKFNLPLPGGKKLYLENDLNFRLDFAIRDNRTIVRLLDNEKNDPYTGGQRMLQLRPNIEYMISRSLSINIFFNRNVSKPYTSTGYPTKFTNGGFSLRYIIQ
ncbi:MAG: cell surface protein SprA, partial [Bacteroidota bacterium]|nr:cell surface protein SprA [Bacteroidota bacterium]